MWIPPGDRKLIHRSDRLLLRENYSFAEETFAILKMAEHWNSETIAQCPYNPAHLVPKMRFPNHLVKCQKNYPHVELKICPYNATHRIKAEVYLQHLLDCPNRQCIEFQKYHHPFPQNSDSPTNN